MADGGLGWMSVCRDATKNKLRRSSIFAKTEDCLHREIPRRMSGLIAYLRQEKALYDVMNAQEHHGWAGWPRKTLVLQRK